MGRDEQTGTIPEGCTTACVCIQHTYVGCFRICFCRGSIYCTLLPVRSQRNFTPDRESQNLLIASIAIPLASLRHGVESFIEHQDMCDAGGRPPRGDTTSSSAGRGGGARAASASTSHRQQQQQLHAAAGASLSRTASSASPSSGADLVGSPVAWPAPSPTAHQHNLELQLMPPRGTAGPIARRASPPAAVIPKPDADANAMRLELSIGVRFGAGAREDSNSSSEAEDMAAAARALKGEAREQLRLAAMEKAAADETRAEARRHAELAEQELAGARRMREQARAELGRAHAVRDHAVRQLDAALLEITCYGCRGKFRARAATMAAASYDVPSVVTEGEAGIGNGQQMALLQYDAADDRLPRGRRAMMDMN
ncbi:hypothetical protein BRADI_3g37890v3 [Brachypodium distachyon]|uniref:Uncharacterized protein n=1 Tax=Brachypodium distachyon TaxID=15368 RepID=A0A0Q3FG43_BRADI|nr:hypothetical protein BRADI_3g37890v3 [Brachypodium distachyon]PNT68256.1 hypothetical protein BRADI_3g37890v3 [Brachypodium distachyon]